MSWAKHIFGRGGVKKKLSGIAICLVPFCLTACGFHPIYDRQNFPGLARQLAAIEVAPIAEHRGQIMRSRLQERLRIASDKDGQTTDAALPSSDPAQTSPPIPIKDLLLQVNTAEVIYGVSAQLDNTSVYSRINFNANYTLIDKEKGKTILRGTITSSLLYALPTDGYAESVAEDSAREHAISDLADILILRLQVFLANDFRSDIAPTPAPTILPNIGSPRGR